MQTRREAFQNILAPVTVGLMAARAELLGQSITALNTAAINANKSQAQKLTHQYFYSREALTDALAHVININGWGDNGAPDVVLEKPIADRLAVAETLIKAGADVNAKHSASILNTIVTDFTPLHLATGLGEAELARLLIKHKADINARYTFTFDADRDYILKISPAAETIKTDQPYALQLLLDNGVKADALGTDGSGFVRNNAGKLLHEALEQISGVQPDPFLTQTLLAHGATFDEDAKKIVKDIESRLLFYEERNRSILSNSQISGDTQLTLKAVQEASRAAQATLDLCKQYEQGKKIPHLPPRESVRPGQKPAQAFRFLR